MESPKTTLDTRGEAKQSNLAAGTPEVTEVLKDSDSTSKQIKKATYQEKRRAAFILSKADLSTENAPAGEELLRWAKSVLPNFQPAKAGSSGKSTKRQRSMDEHITQTKRTRKDRILIGVLDRGFKDGWILRDHWRIVENELQDRFLQLLELNGGQPPMCEDAGWHQGSVKAIACHDVNSANLYKKAVASIGEVYKGAKLEAVDWDKIPSKLRARAWISAKPAEPERILRLLQVCNPHLPTANWWVVKVGEVKGLSRQIILTIDEKSAEIILKSDGLVTYGFKKVAIRIYKSDAKNRQIGVNQDLEVEDANTEPSEEDILLDYASDESCLARGLRGVLVEDDDFLLEADHLLLEADVSQDVSKAPALPY